MTSKERMMTAFHRQIPDHVPVCPDISVMVPSKLTGKPFYELFLDGREHNGWTSATYSEAYVEAVKYFGMDGWYIEEKFMDEVQEFWMEWALAYLRANVAAKPDEIMLGGSSASLSVSSPNLFRKYELPFIKQASKICKEAGVISHLHICGRSWKLVQIVAEETDVDVMEPMEEPPGGDVDLAEAKRRVGNKLCIKGRWRRPMGDISDQ
ncbi:hypothetical protein L0337_45235 [candidate division KSB1 bacterium]|nr:hypothetical protein [candidate division KSB1 bacterium]